MKKEYFLLIAIIAALSIYLVTRDTDNIRYELPDMPTVTKKEVSKIQIDKTGEKLVLHKEGSNWVVGPEKYPADSKKVDDMLETIESLTLTALVSESKSYDRFDLGDDKKIGIKAWVDNRLKREFYAGKAAGTHQHTFVALPDDDNVYHARGNFRITFDAGIDDLRDKSVMKFNKNDISQIRLIQGNNNLTLTRESIPVNVNVNDAETVTADGVAEETNQDKPQNRWLASNGKDVDEGELDRLLTGISDLSCQKYIYDRKKEHFTIPIYTLEIKGSEDHVLSIFSKADEDANEYPASSSFVKDPFLLPKWRAEKIMVDLDEIVKSEEPR